MIQNTEVFLKMGASASGTQSYWVPLEINGNIPFPLTYNIADVRDITKRNTTFSKTLEIPGTKNNDDVLGYLFDISSVSSYNVNEKVPVTIVCDTVPVITDAYFQIKKIKSNDNIHFTYECLIVGETDNIVKDIGVKLMTDLDVHEMGHTYGTQSILQSWDPNWSWANGYYYGLADYGNNWDITDIGPLSTTGVRVADMKPQMFVKYLWRKMFSDIGWSYESNFIDQVGGVWDNLVLAGGSALAQSVTFSYFHSFSAGLTSSVRYVLGHTYSTHSDSSYISTFGNRPLNSLQFGYNTNTYFQYGNSIMNGDSGPFSTTSVARKTSTGFNFLFDYEYDTSGNHYASFTNSRMPFTDEINYPYGDPSNLYDTNVFEYTVTSTGDISIGVDVDITLASTQSYFGPTGSLIGMPGIFNPCTLIYFDIVLYRSSLFTGTGTGKKYYPINGYPGLFNQMISAWPVGVLIAATNSSHYAFNSTHITMTNGNDYQRIYPGTTTYKRFNTTIFNDTGTGGGLHPYSPLLVGEKVWAKIVVRPSLHIPQVGFVPLLEGVVGKNFEYTLTTGSRIWNHIDPTLYPGQDLDPKSILPKQFKQIDFFTGLVKMFNLYIDVDKSIAKRIRLEPRDDFYNSGIELNWTNKVDIDKDIDQQVISDTQFRRIIPTYKLDSDGYNKDYNIQTKEIYGQYIYNVDNEFTKGDQQIEVPFASTPVTSLDGVGNLSNDGIVLPVIVKTVHAAGGMDFIPRILFRSSNGTVPFLDINNYLRFEGILYPYYPYIGHYNEPRTATDDLNFGQVKFLYYNLNVVQSNNLFTNYYEKQLQELTDRDSRIITLNLKLTPQDMNDFSFRDRIILDGICSGSINYFRINKIEYDPTSKGTFKVELLKALDIPRREQRPIHQFNNASHTNAIDGFLSTGYNNNIYSHDTLAIGSGIFVEGNSTGILINGNDISVGANSTGILFVGSTASLPPNSYRSMVIGAGNDISSTNQTIIGDSNSTSNGVRINITGNSNTLR